MFPNSLDLGCCKEDPKLEANHCEENVPSLEEDLEAETNLAALCNQEDGNEVW